MKFDIVVLGKEVKSMRLPNKDSSMGAWRNHQKYLIFFKEHLEAIASVILGTSSPRPDIIPSNLDPTPMVSHSLCCSDSYQLSFSTMK